jgi:hypothetical protein
MFQPHLADPISPINTSSRAFRLRAVKRLEFTNAVKARAPVMIRRRKNEAYPREETRTELLELWVLVLMVFSSTIGYLKAGNIQAKSGCRLLGACPFARSRYQWQRDRSQTQVKGRQALLAGTQPTRLAETDVERDIAGMEKLAQTGPIRRTWSD